MSAATRSQPVVTADGGGLQPTFDELCQNTRLLIKFRWVAGFSILLSTGLARVMLGIRLQTTPLLIIGLTVLSYNSVLFFLTCRCEDRRLARVWRIAWGQIILDWMAMIGLVHFTGGVTSPALIYFVIHAALSGTILFPWQARSLAALAILLVGGLACLECMGGIPHVSVPELGLDDDLYKNTTYIAAVVFFFGTTVITLSELVSHIAQRLRQREARIQQLYEARSTFVRVATHELRAPLGAALSLIRNIEEGYAGEFNEQQAAILYRVTSRLEGLRTLIDDLLTLAASREASAANAPLEPASTRSALEKIIERETPNSIQKQITLHIQLANESGIVLAGEVGLMIIFGNLLNNAIKYTPEGGQVTLTHIVNPAAQTVEITLTDTGIGIPTADLPRIFNEFFRASNVKNAHVPGSGIGLTAVRTLIDRYQGTITLESNEGKGTTVRVVLPLATSQTLRATAEAKSL